jgi:hypothetical protein
VPQSLMQWSGVSGTVRRKSQISARTWTRRTSSKPRRTTSLGPHPNPRHPCKTHNPPTRPLQSQHTATSMLNHTTHLHRRSHEVSMPLRDRSRPHRLRTMQHHKSQRPQRLLLARLRPRRPPTTLLRMSPKARQLHPGPSSMRQLILLRRPRRAQSTLLRGPSRVPSC